MANIPIAPQVNPLSVLNNAKSILTALGSCTLSLAFEYNKIATVANKPVVQKNASNPILSRYTMVSPPSPLMYRIFWIAAAAKQIAAAVGP